MNLTIVLFALFNVAQGIAGLAMAFLMFLLLLLAAGIFVRTVVRPMGIK